MQSASVYKPNQSKTALNKYVAGFWCDKRQEMHFSTIIMNYGLIF